MPLDPGELETYPEGLAASPLNLKGHMACDNVLQTYTVQADGKIGSCCGIGMRLIPELNVTTVDQPDFLRAAIDEAESDYLKLWIRYKGPEQVLSWAASKDPTIAWEGRYAHRCQACARVYRDPSVAQVIREHHREMIAEIIQTAWIDECIGSLTSPRKLADRKPRARSRPPLVQISTRHKGQGREKGRNLRSPTNDQSNKAPTSNI